MTALAFASELAAIEAAFSDSPRAAADPVPAFRAELEESLADFDPERQFASDVIGHWVNVFDLTDAVATDCFYAITHPGQFRFPTNELRTHLQSVQA